MEASGLLRIALLVATPLLSAARCGTLGSQCTTRSSIRCPSMQGVCLTHGGCSDRSQCSSAFDANDFFDDCECDEDGSRYANIHGLSPTPAPESTPAPQEGEDDSSTPAPDSTPAPQEGEDDSNLGETCVNEKCTGREGIMKTKNGCTVRSECDSSFDQNSFFDECTCTIGTGTDVKFFGVPGMVIVFLITLLGLALYVKITLSFGSLEIIQRLNEKGVLKAPLGIASFYSLFTFGFTLLVHALSPGNNVGDFFTSFSFTFIVMIVGLITPMAIWKLGISMDTAIALVLGFCQMAGYFTFAFCTVMMCLGAASVLVLMKTTLCFTRKSFGGEPSLKQDSGEDDEHGSHGETAGLACALGRILCQGWNQLGAVLMRIVNFILQSALIACSIGDVKGIKRQVAAEIEYTYDVSARMPELHLPDWCGWGLEGAAVVSSAMNRASEEVSSFMLNYTNIWTPNITIAYTSVGVFEVFVVVAVFGIVLSDLLLILAPRQGSKFVGKQVQEFVSRGMLYALQVLVSASHALMFALLYIRPIERPELSDSQEFFNEMTIKVGVPVTLFYIVIVMGTALVILLKLWSGDDAGLQMVAMRLLTDHNVAVKDFPATQSAPCAFLLAFFGIWPEYVLDAFEIRQRACNFRLEQKDVMLATVNALSFPLYIMPLGPVVAKLGEYLNQSPVYVAGKGFRWSNFVFALTYLVEYILVLVMCRELLDTHGEGIADNDEIREVGKQNGSSLISILIVLFVLAFTRSCVKIALRLGRCKGGASNDVVKMQTETSHTADCKHGVVHDGANQAVLPHLMKPAPNTAIEKSVSVGEIASIPV